MLLAFAYGFWQSQAGSRGQNSLTFRLQPQLCLDEELSTSTFNYTSIYLHDELGVGQCETLEATIKAFNEPLDVI